MSVFISYASSDRDIADALADKLSEYGLEAWYADKDVLPGENWAKKVGEALEEADALVVILSPGSEGMKSMKREISFAMGNKRFKNRLVPLYRGNKSEIKEDVIPWSLKEKRGIHLDAYPKREDAFEEVARWLKKEQNPA
jgi:pyruvate/2-oxoacid:ferredoxin oxidoreductase beta subunit